VCVCRANVGDFFFFCRLKLKRPQAVKAYKAQIDQMYDEINAGVTVKAKL
jgi:hypothetical protein